jgi:hypothetical protein
MALPPETRNPRSTSRPTSGKPQPELSFEPLSQGLGFHPFSDGLPYAPVSKAPATGGTGKAPQPAPLKMGTGAMVAGRPIYAPPAPARAPHVPTPATSIRQPSFSSTLTQSQAQAIASRLTPEMLQPEYGFGYVVKRAFAYLLDSLFNLGLCAAALSAALWKQHLSPELLLTPSIVLVAALFLCFFNWAITTAQEVAFGTSIGKRLFGLAFDAERGSASAIFLRAFFFIPSLCFGGLGLLWALIDHRRRCWHDLVVDLQPLEIPRS